MNQLEKPSHDRRNLDNLAEQPWEPSMMRISVGRGGPYEMRQTTFGGQEREMTFTKKWRENIKTKSERAESKTIVGVWSFFFLVNGGELRNSLIDNVGKCFTWLRENDY